MIEDTLLWAALICVMLGSACFVGCFVARSQMKKLLEHDNDELTQMKISMTQIALDKKIELHELEENHYNPRRHSDHAL